MMIDSALGYAERGYEVLPLNGKVPLVEHGFHDATVDTCIITEWWQRWPTANIGCRPPENILILDIDPRNGGSLAALGDYPRTRTAQTGSGGFHVWFAARGRFAGAFHGAPGIDIKTPNSLVVMPPSIHPVTGQRYRWLNGGAVVPLPERLIPHVVKPVRKRSYAPAGGKLTDRQVAGILRKMEDAPEGSRNSTLLWCACRLFEAKAGPDTFAELESTAEATGLDNDEILRTIESAQRRAGTR